MNVPRPFGAGGGTDGRSGTASGGTDAGGPACGDGTTASRGGSVAEALEISRSTLAEHLAAAQRKRLGSVPGED